jgi:internalin A
VLPANTCITFESTATYDDIATIALLPETKALVLEPIGPGPLDLSPLTALRGLLRLKVDASLTSLAPLASLPIESLFLNTTVSIGDPAPLGSLHSLRELTVFALPSLDTIAPLTGLQRLTVGGRNLSSLKGLASLKQLRFLEVLSSAATDVAPVAALTELRSLRLDHTKITALPDLSALKNLSNLALRSDDLTDLAHLPKGLQTLVLTSNKRLKDLAPLASLTNLGSLDISDTAVTSLAPLASLKKLRSLQVSKDLPASEVDTLKKALPDLRVER